MTKVAATETKLVRLQVQVRESTVNALKVEAAAEIIPVAVLVRRVLDQHVSRQDVGGVR